MQAIFESIKVNGGCAVNTFEVAELIRFAATQGRAFEAVGSTVNPEHPDDLEVVDVTPDAE